MKTSPALVSLVLAAALAPAAAGAAGKAASAATTGRGDQTITMTVRGNVLYSAAVYGTADTRDKERSMLVAAFKNL